MLVVSRHVGDSIRIGADVEILIAGIVGSRVKLGIRAPRTMAVITRQMKLVREQNVAAAAAMVSAPALSSLAARLLREGRERRRKAARSQVR